MAIDLNDLATAMGQLVLRFRIRRRTSADWTSGNEVLLSAEMGYETDTSKAKIGDGTTHWNDLAYVFEDVSLDSDNAGAGITIGTGSVGGHPGSGGSTGSDADWSDVSLLLHFDGANGDTSTADYGPVGLSVSNAGSAVLSTAQAKFGTSSLYCGSGSAPGMEVLDAPAINFGAGDWSVEGFFYPVSTGFSESRILWSKYHLDSFGTPVGIYLGVNASGNFEASVTDSGGTRHVQDFTPVGSYNYANGAWNHVGLYRNGNNVTLFVNGVQWEVGTSGGMPVYSWVIGAITLDATTDPLSIGYSNNGTFGSFVGYVDEYRITKGVGRANAVPVAAYPSFTTPIDHGRIVTIITNDGVRSIVAGANITVNVTDPHNPTVSSTGGGGSLSPDTQPSSPTPYDDEFEYGSGADTTGGRRTSANAWTLHCPLATVPPVVEQGYIGANYGTSGFGSSALMLQPIPTGDCSFVIKIKRRTLASGNGGWNLGFFNSATGKIYSMQIYTSPTMATQEGTFDLSTWEYTGNSNPFTASTITDVNGWMWLRLRLVGSTMHCDWNTTGHNTEWIEATSEAVSTWVSSITHVALFQAGSVAVCDYFRRTA